MSEEIRLAILETEHKALKEIMSEVKNTLKEFTHSVNELTERVGRVQSIIVSELGGEGTKGNIPYHLDDIRKDMFAIKEYLFGEDALPHRVSRLEEREEHRKEADGRRTKLVWGSISIAIGSIITSAVAWIFGK